MDDSPYTFYNGPSVLPLKIAPFHGDLDQGRNHVFKGGVQFIGLGYYTEQNTDGIPSFVHCSLQLRKKLGWSVQI